MTIKQLIPAVIFTAATLVLAPATASAQSFGVNAEAPFFDLLNERIPGLTVLEVQREPVIPERPPEPKPEPKPVEPLRYTVRSGDNLTEIAAAHSTSWLRLWNKNTELTNPDLIFPGQVFLIPDNAEKLEDRPVPQPVIEKLAPAAATRGPVAGNTYSYGYCTWYVKNRRPDLPNNLGNANTWYARAAAQGYAVGSEPRAGAVGTTTAGDLGHVVFVERVNGDGTIVISEYNYSAWNTYNSRTVSASSFVYIY
jgi:LysM repeat protein